MVDPAVPGTAPCAERVPSPVVASGAGPQSPGRRACLAALAGGALAGCGAADLGPPGPASGTAAVLEVDATLVAPVDDVDRLTVKGVELDTAGASFVDADGRERPIAELEVGTTVAVDARVATDGSRGVARRVVATVAAQGPVEQVRAGDAPPTIVVLGTTVRTDPSTTLDGAETVAALPVGAAVRVFGLPAADGSLTASRIEVWPQPWTEFRLQGIARNVLLGAATMDLGGLRIAFSGAAVVGGTPADGLRVTVRAERPPAGGQWVVTRVEVEAVPGFAAGGVAAIEGLVSQFRSLADFRVGGVPVDGSRAAIVGQPGTLRDGVRVTVRGTWRGDRLEASSIGFLAFDAPRTIVGVGPVAGVPLFWGPTFWGPGWFPWVPAGVGVIVGTAPATAWWTSPVPARPSGFLVPLPRPAPGFGGPLAPSPGFGVPGLPTPGVGLPGGTVGEGFGPALPGAPRAPSPSRPRGGWWGSRPRGGRR